jgi:hypothetical protein
MKRYFPHLAAGMATTPAAEEATETAATSKKAGNTSTNQLTIDVKLRALNLDKGGASGLNGQLAYAVRDAFRSNPLFESDGTDLADQIQSVEPTADTFTFGMKLKFKNAMQTM